VRCLLCDGECESFQRFCGAGCSSRYEAGARIQDTLADALPREMARVRDQVIPAYLSIGPSGTFALTMMRRALDEATVVTMNGDVLGMIAAYRDLKGYKL
jgi:hypothetical protein